MSMIVNPHECQCERELERDRERVRDRERERERDRDVDARPIEQNIAWYGICLSRTQIWIHIFVGNKIQHEMAIINAN